MTTPSASFDAEGERRGDICPECGSYKTITYLYREGFSELECEACGFASDADELSALNRFRGDLKESTTGKLPPIPIKKLEA